MLDLGIPSDMIVLGIRVIFSAALALSITLGIILSYHWLRFAMSPVMPIVAVVAYGAVCAVILSVMLSLMQAL